jgi:dTDP-glucose 4,6-dehydratase
MELVYPDKVSRILITGGAGFIGSNLVHFLHDKTDSLGNPLSITVLDSLTYAGNTDNLKGATYNFVQGDVRNVDIVNDLVSKTDVIFHLAAESHVDRSIAGPEIFIDTNVRGSLNILEAARNFSKRVLLISTDEVYGSLETGFADEAFPIDPTSPYSASKAAADILALAYHKTYKLDVIITRCSNNYGPRQFPEKLIPLSILKILQNKKIPIYGNGLNVRDWIHVDDHCAGLYLAMLNGRSGQVYNFGSNEQYTNIEIVKKLLEITGKSYELISFVEDRSGHDFRYAINSERARRELGWIPVRTLARDLQDVVSYYKGH